MEQVVTQLLLVGEARVKAAVKTSRQVKQFAANLCRRQVVEVAHARWMNTTQAVQQSGYRALKDIRCVHPAPKAGEVTQHVSCETFQTLRGSPKKLLARLPITILIALEKGT
jgi:hypothetical protein